MPNRLYRAYQRAFFHVYGWASVRLYHELAWAYDPISRFVSAGRWAAWRGFALDYVVGPRVLELGFGTGELLIEMRSRGLHPVGLESSPEMHRVTRRKLTALSLSVPRVRAPAQRLPFASGAFDSVLSTFPAGYMLDAATLHEVARVLTPGGRLVIGGLSVILPRSLKYPLAVVPGGSFNRLWAYTQAKTAEAGFRSSLTRCEDGRARVPVIVCTRAEAAAV